MAYEAEFIERAALEDLHAAAPPVLREALALRGINIGSAFVSIAGALPATAVVINRAIGMGLTSPDSKATVQRILSSYQDAMVTRYFIQRHPAAEPPEAVDWLLAAGLERARGWQKFERSREAAPDLKTDLTVMEIGPEQGKAFGQIVCEAFDLGAAAVPWLANLPGRDGWHVFMSFDGDEPAGTGTMFVKDSLAWMDFGATATRFRRRGSQGALLARRVNYALDLGCRALFTCTGEEVPGDPQHSYKNIVKAGFRETYVRENYAPPK